MKVLLVIAFLAVLALLVWGGYALLTRYVTRPSQKKVNSAERQELFELRQLVIELDDLAYSHRELDSLLAPQIIDEIRKSRKAIGELE